MEFKFNVNEVFKQPIVEVNPNLIPPGFSGDRRALWDTVGKVSEIVNSMGEASAAAQGLTKPITTAERLRNSEHKLFFLIDQAANTGKGAVVGMLKTGKKGLYVFDREGQHYQVSPPCVLDFYIHESRQRAGLGRQLFEHMLKKEEVEPVKMAIDRPSDKLLGFLNKHYTLNSPVKQMNNFVVFDGFFPKSEKDNTIDPDNSGGSRKKQSANGLQAVSSPYGRYGAPRPLCSMGQIIHNQSSTINKGQEATGVQSMPATNYQGMQNTSPTLNNYSQSSPNITYEGRILNNGSLNQNPMMVNNTQYQNQANQVYNNLQNMQPNMMVMNDRIQNQIPPNTYQGYNPVQPTMNAGQGNIDHLSMPYNNVQYHSAQNMPSQYLTQNQIHYNNPQNLPNVGLVNQNQMTAVNQSGNQGDVIQNQNNKSQAIQNNQQENQFQNKQQPQLSMTNRWLAPNVVYSQPTLQNQNYTSNEQYQQIQNQTNAAPQNYANPNQQYENINNQAYSQELITNRNAVNMAQGNINNTQPINAGVPYGYQNIQANPNTPLPSQTTIPVNYIPQIQNAGDNLNSSASNNQNQWNQQNLQNTVQYQNYMNNNLDVNANNNIQNPQYISNTMQASHTGINANYPTQASIPVIPSQAHTNIVGNQPPQTLNAEPHILVNPPNQQVIPAAQQDANVRKFASNPAVHLPHAQNLPQSYVQSVPNIPQQQIPPPTYQNMYNPSNIVNNPLAHAPPQGLLNQIYNSQNLDMLKHVTPRSNQVALQNTPSVQYNATQLTNPPIVQMSKHNMPVGAYSAQNMSQGDVIQNVPVTNAYTEERNNKNNEINRAAENDLKQQEISRNDGKGDAKAIEEEGTLMYGYPPQFLNDEQAHGEKVHPSPKLERPRSLSIQQSEEQPDEKNLSDINSKIVEPPTDDINDALNKLEVEIEKDEGTTEKLPDIETENTPIGKKTPSHLTEQGYLDLKFYHNKLW